MKNFLLLFAFLGFVGISSVSAQCNGKKATTSTAAAKTCTKKATCSKTAAAKLASNTPNIESRTCAKSGKVAYYRKDVCAKSGNVSYTEVNYCEKSKAFVNVSPSKADKAANLEGAKAATVANKKAACKKSCKKTCDSKKTAKVAEAAPADAKLVRNNQ